MKFKTHQEIDEYYATQGLDIPKLKREEEAVGIALDESQANAKEFLKKKMGIIKYRLWCIFAGFPFGVYMSRGFGYDGYEEKAKELGWKRTFQYPKGF